MDEAERSPEEEAPVKIPFNNLYLVSGLVHGNNRFPNYLYTVLLFIFGYVTFQLMVFPFLVDRLSSYGYSISEIQETPNLIFNAGALKMDRNLVLALELGMFVFAFIGFYTGLRRFHLKTLTSVLTGFDRFRFSRFWFSFSIWGALILGLTLLSYFSGHEGMEIVFEPGGFLLSLLVLVLLMPVQVGIEELIFRGYLVQGLALIFRNGIIPLAITTLLFGLAHMGNPEVQKHGWMIMLPYYCANAFFLGFITLLDEGLELAYGMHLANNVVSGLLVTSPNSVIQPHTVFMVRNESPGAEMIAWFVMAAIAFGAYYYRYRWKNFTLVIK